MINFSNPFKSAQTPKDSELSFFRLGRKDDQFFADPDSLNHLDQFKAHKLAADELNSHMALLAEVRSAVLPLEGSELDKNPRKEIVAVTDLTLNGKSVSAVIRHYSNTSSLLEARVNDRGRTITLFDDLEGNKETLRFGAGGRYYEVDCESGKSIVDVELRKR